MQDMITQIQEHIVRDWYVRRAARYDVKAIAAVLTADHPGKALADIDADTVWDVMEDHVICRHEPVAGMVYVDLEDLADMARAHSEANLWPIECAKCDAWFMYDTRTWVIR